MSGQFTCRRCRSKHGNGPRSSVVNLCLSCIAAVTPTTTAAYVAVQRQYGWPAGVIL